MSEPACRPVHGQTRPAKLVSYPPQHPPRTGPGDTTSLVGAGCSRLLLSLKSKSHFHPGSPSSMKLFSNKIRECQGLVGLREHLGRHPHFMKSDVFGELPQVTRSLEPICSTSPFLLWSPDHPALIRLASRKSCGTGQRVCQHHS